MIDRKHPVVSNVPLKSRNLVDMLGVIFLLKVVSAIVNDSDGGFFTTLQVIDFTMIIMIS